MIAISGATALLIYVFAWFITIIILWFREIWRLSNYDWSFSKEKLIYCDSCHFAFLSQHGENISRCPRCNEMCFVKKRRGI